MTQISWTDEGGQFSLIVVDATLSESHAAEADVTEDPVEEGSNATDNVRAKSRTLGLEIVVADSYKFGGQVVTEPGRAAAVWAQFEGFEDQGTRLTIDLGGVHTFGKQYTDMVVQSLRMNRTAKEKDTLTLSVAFKKIRTVKSEIVAVVPTKSTSGQKKITGGDQSAKPADDVYESNVHAMFSAFKSAVLP